jgi:hypothetical protein
MVTDSFFVVYLVLELAFLMLHQALHRQLLSKCLTWVSLRQLSMAPMVVVCRFAITVFFSQRLMLLIQFVAILI